MRRRLTALFEALTGRRVRELERRLELLQADYAELGKEHARVQVHADIARREQAYWQRRAEKLVDSALSRAQAISEPVMAQREPNEFEKATRSVVASLGMTSFPKA